MNRPADTGQRPLALPADTPVSDDCTPGDYSRPPFLGPGQERGRTSLSGSVVERSCLSMAAARMGSTCVTGDAHVRMWQESSQYSVCAYAFQEN